MNCSNIYIDRLVAEVQLKPEVWNADSYMPHIRNEAWKEIAVTLGTKMPMVKLKWKNVRDIFRREFIKSSLTNQAIMTSPDQYTGKWRYFRQLWPIFKSLRESLKSDSKLKNCVEKDGELDERLEEEEESEGEEEVKTQSTTKIKQKDKIKQSPRNDDEYEDNQESESIFLEEFIPESPRAAEPDRDYDSMYLNSLLPFFRMLSPVRKLCVRNQIQSLLIKELNEAGKM